MAQDTVSTNAGWRWVAERYALGLERGWSAYCAAMRTHRMDRRPVLSERQWWTFRSQGRSWHRHDDIMAEECQDQEQPQDGPRAPPP